MTTLLGSSKKNAKKSPRTTNNKIYNTEVKERYLTEMLEQGRISENTQKTYSRLFKKIYEHEAKKMKKDLCQYTFEEMENLFISFKANNRNTVESYARVLSSYLYWAVENGLSKENVIAKMKPTDFDSYLAEEEEYFTEEQILEMEENCENAQDAVIIRMLFNGFGGKELSEIRNLTKHDIDKNSKMIHLVNTLKADKDGTPIEYTERWEPVDDYTLELIEDALEEHIYIKKNGNVSQSGEHRVPTATELVENDYVIRASKLKATEENKPANRHVVYRRILMLSEYYNMKSKINAKFIMRSGMIYQASKIMKDGELTVNNLKTIAKNFNLQSHHNLKAFLTVENVYKTYPEQSGD